MADQHIAPQQDPLQLNDQQPPQLPPRQRAQPAGLQLVRTPPILKLSMDLDTYLRRFDAYTQSIGATPDDIPHLLINSLDDETLQYIERHLVENITLPELLAVLRREMGISRLNREDYKAKLRKTLRGRNEDVRSFYSKLWNIAKRAWPDAREVREANLRDVFIGNLQDSSISARLRERPELNNEQLLDFAVTLLNCKNASLSRQSEATLTKTPSLIQLQTVIGTMVIAAVSASITKIGTITGPEILASTIREANFILVMQPRDLVPLTTTTEIVDSTALQVQTAVVADLDHGTDHKTIFLGTEIFRWGSYQQEARIDSYNNIDSYPHEFEAPPHRSVTFDENVKTIVTTQTESDDKLCIDTDEKFPNTVPLTVNSSTDCSLPYIKAVFNNNVLNCLIDTGSAANLLNHSCLHKLGQINVRPTTVQLCGINKSSVNVHGETTINLEIGGKICPIDAIIADITTEVVLGNPFIKEHSALVNLKNKLLTLPSPPSAIVQINGSHNVTSNTEQNLGKTLINNSTSTVHCVEGVTIPPYHAGWAKVTLNTDTYPDNVLVYPGISFDPTSPGQLMAKCSSSNEYSMFLVNNSEDPLEIEHNDTVGHADLAPQNEHDQFEFTTVENDISINSAYRLKLSDSDKELRWSELCKTLKVDKWEVSEAEKIQAIAKLRDFEFVFALENEPLGLLHDYYHDIDVGDATPIRMRPRPLSDDKQKDLQVIIDDLLNRGLIKPSRSPWSSPIVLSRKSNGSWRLCCDYRRLNQVTVKDAFPIPNINHMLSTMKHSKFFSTMDLASGFHQLKILPEKTHLTAFCTMDALYEWFVVPFGLCNGPPTFVRALSSVLKVPKSLALIYFDDILTLGSSFSVHLQNLTTVLDILQSANLKLKAEKCKLFATKIEFVGHVISQNGISCSPEKIDCIKKISAPSDPKKLRSYLGFFSYYRKFVPKYSEIARPLYKLAVADKKDFDWTTEADAAFRELQCRLVNAPILTLPTDDDEYILVTDASGFAIGSVLCVTRPEGRKVVAYASHLLAKSRRSYGATKRELYSIVYYVQYFKMFLLPKQFTVESDHKCLQYITNFKDPPAILARWLAILADYKFKIIHRPGTNSMIKIADNLSRPLVNLNELPYADTPRDNLLDICPDNLGNTNSPPPKALQPVPDEKRPSTNIDTNLTDREITDANPSYNLTVDNAQYIDHKINDSKINAINSTNVDINNSTQNSADTVPDVDTGEDRSMDTDHTIATPPPAVTQTTITDYTTQISLAQNKDKNIKLLKSRLLNDRDKSIHDISSDPPSVKFYWSYKDRLKIENDILYFGDSKNQGKYRIIVPHGKIDDLLKLAHDDQTAGHRSGGKMLPLLKQNYHWFKMRSDIDLHVKRCQSCGAHKKPRVNRPRAALYQTKVSSRFERLSVDFAGPFNRTQRGNRFVLLGLCNFTKFGFCIPMSNTDSEHVARVLIERWVCYFGVPLQINSDAGSNLISDLIKHLYRLLNIKMSHSLSYVPQQNGQAEKLVSTMKNMMCHFAAGNPAKWDFYAPLVSLAYNSQVHSSTKCTPFDMVMGPDAIRLPLDFAWGAPPVVEDIDEPDYVAFLRDAMYDIHDYALTNLNSSLVTTKDRFDKGQFGKPYEKDDLVWKLKGRFESGSRKFQKRYDGIYRVREKLSNTSYLIQHLKTHKEEIIHFNRLKRAYLNPLTLQSLLEKMNDRTFLAPETEEEIDLEEPIFIGCRPAQNDLNSPAPPPPPPRSPPPIARDQDTAENLDAVIRHTSRRGPAVPTRRIYNLRPRRQN
ncbi:hypothetical protein ACHWQZ_G011677 [Mnemiopsis leidyi]